MHLIDVYIYEVTRRVPEKGRADIALELRSTIEDMLSDDYSEKEVKEVLEKLGNPAVLASGYKDQPMHLIGPRYYDVYITLLKMIFPISAIITLISIVANYFIGFSGDEAIVNVILDLMGIGIGGVIESGVHVFFWLTLVFFILERMDKDKGIQPLTTSLEKWTPDDLKNIPFTPKEKRISKGEVFGSLMWTAIWATFYFYANHLLGIYEGGGESLEFVIPAFNQDTLLHFWPIIIVIIALEIAFALYKLISGQWTKLMATFNALFELFATVVLIILLSNSNLLNEQFIEYMSNLFNTTNEKFVTWLVGGGIIGVIVTAAINVFCGFRKSRL